MDKEIEGQVQFVSEDNSEVMVFVSGLGSDLDNENKRMN